MFKYLPKDPDSIRSVLAASFRLYFKSLKYSLALAVSASIIMGLSFEFFLDRNFNAIVAGLYSSVISLIFFIPLVKRIYSVGAGLPITTGHAFDDFVPDFVRITLLFCLITLGTTLFNIGIALSSYNQWTLIAGSFLLLFLYAYFLVKIYFASLIIILENKNIFKALVESWHIEHHHMWLTFWVLFTYLVGFALLLTFIQPYIESEAIELVVNLVASIIGFPLFICVQLVQFMNLKQLYRAEHTGTQKKASADTA